MKKEINMLSNLFTTDYRLKLVKNSEFKLYTNGKINLPPEDIRLSLIVNNKNLNFSEKAEELRRVKRHIIDTDEVLTYEKR